MKKGIIYSRVSTNLQTTDRQLYNLTEYAKNNNIEIVKVFNETVSGAKDNRKEFELMKDFIFNPSNEIEILLTSEVSRLGRKRETLLFMDHCAESGINIYFQLQNLYLLENGKISTAMNLILPILNAFAISERQQMIDRMNDKISMKKALGLSTNGRVSYGELFNKVSGKIEIDPQKVPVILEYFKLYSEGYSWNKLYTHFKNKNINITHYQLRSIIVNKRLLSLIVDDSVLLDKIRLRRETLPTEFIQRTTKNLYLLRDKVICGCCGATYKYSSSKVLVCGHSKSYSANRGQIDCSNKQIRMNVIEELIWKLTVKYIKEEGYFLYKERVEQLTNNREKEIRSKLIDIESDLYNISEKLRKLGNVYISGIIKESDFELRKRDLQREQNNKLKSKEILNSELLALSKTSCDMNLTNIETMDHSQKCIVIEKILESVTIKYKSFGNYIIREFEVKFKGAETRFYYLLHKSTSFLNSELYVSLGYKQMKESETIRDLIRLL